MLNNTIRNSIQTHFFSKTKPKSSEAYSSYSKIDDNDKEVVDNDKEVVDDDKEVVDDDKKVVDDINTPSTTIAYYKKLPPVTEKNNISYSGDKLFDKEELDKKSLPAKVEVCIFTIETSNMNPFLKFLLTLSFKNHLVFPTFGLKDSSIEKMIEYIKSLFDSSAVITYEGKTDINNTTQLWFKYSLNNKIIQQGNYDDKYKWVLPYEIINLRKMLTFDIGDEVTRMFMNQRDLLFLRNDEGSIYQTPIIGYYGNYYKRTKISAALGHMSESPDALFGPYYYFNTYGRAMRYACWSTKREPTYINGELITNDQKGRYIKGGLVRYALFLDNYTSIVSELSGKDQHNSLNINIDIKRGGDFDGLIDSNEIRKEWMYYYDTIIDCRYRDKITKSYHQGHYADPTYVLKVFEKQTPLEYYYVDTNKVVDPNMDVSNLIIE